MKEFIEKFIAADGLKNDGPSFHDFNGVWRATEDKSTLRRFYSFATPDVNKQMKEIRAEMAEKGYIEFKIRHSLFFMMNGTREQGLQIVTMTYGPSRISFRMSGDPKVVNRFIDEAEQKYPDRGIEVNFLTDYGRGSGAYDTRFMFPEQERLGKQEFYPWLKTPLDKYIADFYASSQNVLLLIGPPGTGKSTILRSFILADPKRRPFVVSNDLLVMNEQFVPWVQNREDNATIVVEDADRLVTPRENDNAIMSGVLNAADGILTTKRKIIISTNLGSLKNVDQALIRDGRCFDIMQFSQLTPTEANRARVAVGLKRKRFEADITSISLASALHYKDAEHHHSRQKRSIGF